MCFILLGLPGVSAAASNTIELIRIGFFEGRSDTLIPEWDSPRIKSTFARASTRSIFALLQIRDLEKTAANRDRRVIVRFVRPDGTLLGENRLDLDLDHAAKRELLELTTSWGWDTPNHWDTGFYRVEVRLGDGTPIGESRFFIKADTRFVTLTGGVRFEQIGFYEAGDDGIELAPEDWPDDRLGNHFIGDEARYIYTMIRLRNLKWNIEEQNVKIHLYYYRPSGDMFGDPVIDYTIPADWETAELWNGWGWSEAGHWEPGQYRVELWLDDQHKIGQGYFDID